MKTYGILMALALTTLTNCQSINNKNQLAAFQDNAKTDEITVVLYSNPKHCDPCKKYEEKFEELKTLYANNKNVKIYDKIFTGPFVDAKNNFTADWSDYSSKHNIKTVPTVRVWVKDENEKYRNDPYTKKSYTEFVGAVEQESNIKQHIANALSGNQNSLPVAQQPTVSSTPAVKDDRLTIGQNSFEIIKDPLGSVTKLKEGDYTFDPSTTSAVTLGDGSILQAKKSDAGYLFEHCVDGVCKVINFKPIEYTLYPDLTAETATTVEDKVFFEVKVESKICGDEACEFKEEMAKLEDIVANKYEGLSYEEVKEALEELKETNDDFKDIAIPDLKQ